MVETISSGHSEQANRSPQKENTSVISCIICGAGYAPSQPHQYLLQEPRSVLESAFMSMCHFCFRCRRPACLKCWDAVHGVCGACVQEARLPFRTEVTPLAGLAFPPTHQAQTAQENAIVAPLICVHPGRFQAQTPHTDPLFTEPPKTANMESSKQSREKPVEPSTLATQILPTATKPQREKTEEPSTLETWILPTATKPQKNNVPTRRGRRVIKIIRRFLIAIILVMVLAIAALIALAEYSSAANTQILQLLHVDIRAGVAYLLHLL